jgi:hypothetical protein
MSYFDYLFQENKSYGGKKTICIHPLMYKVVVLGTVLYILHWYVPVLLVYLELIYPCSDVRYVVLYILSWYVPVPL